MALVKYNNNSLSSVTSAAGFPAGAMTLIKTLTASSSASVSFIHGSSDVVFDSTYPIYMFKWINTHHATGDRELVFQGTTDGSNFNVTMTSTYFYAYQMEGDSNTLSYDTSRDQGQGTDFQRLTLPVRTDNDGGAAGEMFIFNPSSTTFVKHFISRSAGMGEDSYAQDVNVAGYFNTTSAITGIQFKARTGNLDSGTIKLYGIKDS
tara:strand:+ start:75 stop:692 length:618 start_codon:yes stop_codon:yes gene_type:complete